MKKLIFCAAMIALGLTVTNPSLGQKQKLIPVTTKSEKALVLYNQAMAAIEDYDFSKFIDLATLALKEDSDFFMANEQLAMYYLSYPVDKKFEEYATKAINCKTKLSKGEMLQKDALAKLLEKQDADATAFGKKLVELYPKDVNSFRWLTYYQSLAKDYNGAVETMKKAIALAENPGTYYNWLGYTYMTLGQFEDARAAFDKYIELEPDFWNPYDSKGDYFMSIKDYQKAYESFMKVNALNPTLGFQKAMNAKTNADSPLSDTETLAERKAIGAIILGEIKASLSLDFEKWSGCIAQEPFTTWVMAGKDGYEFYKGWNEINNKIKEAYINAKENSISYTFDGISDYIVRIYNNAALVTYTLKLKVLMGGKEVAHTGKLVRSLEKRDGNWKIIYLGSVYTSTWEN